MNTLRTNRLASRLVAKGRVSVVYDPQTKQKYRYLERYKTLDKYDGRDDVFVSFTSIPKLGINPQTKYRTPVGVYSYPVSYVRNQVFDSQETGVLDFNVPFPPVERQNYLHIFEVKSIDRALHFSDNDTSVLDKYKSPEEYGLPVDELELIQDVINGIRDFFNETQGEIEEITHGTEETRAKYRAWLDNYSKLVEPLETIDPALVWVFYEGAGINYHDMDKFLDPKRRDSVYNYMKFKVLESLYEKRKVSENLFPYEAELMKLVIPSLVSEEEYYRVKKRALDQRVVCDQAFVWNMTRNLSTSSAKWTGLMRQVGIIGAVDNGTGTIHPSEPDQAVFFDLSSIRRLEVIHNERPKQLKNAGPQSVEVSSEFSSWAMNAEENLKFAVRQVLKIIDNLSMKLKHPGEAYPGMIKYSMRNIMKILGWIHTNARNAEDWYPLRKNLMMEMEILATLVKKADMGITPEMDRVMQMLSR